MNEAKLAELKEKIFAEYMQKTQKSKKMYERACKSLAGGISGNVSIYEPYPLYMTHAKGSKTYDLDGNEYVDCFLCSGPLLLGHNNPDIIAAIKREIDRGYLMLNPDLMVEAAELLQEISPCAERVRFTINGTDACMFVARFARAYTGKNKIIKFGGHFHGEGDQFMTGTSTPKDAPIGGGIPKEALANTILLPWNDLDAVKRKLDEDKDVAGIMMDSQATYAGLWPPEPGYLQGLRKLTKERGVMMIFDEVVTGFRIALGGAQEYFGVTGDLAVYAKGLAGGEKLAAITGKKEVMDVAIPALSPFEKKPNGAHQSGTYRDNTVALAASIAAMKTYQRLDKEGTYPKYHKYGADLRAAIEETFKKRGVPGQARSFGPSLKLFLSKEKYTFEKYASIDKRPLYLLCLSLITEGVMLSVPSSGSIFLSFTHTEQDAERIVKALDSTLQKHRFEEIM